MNLEERLWTIGKIVQTAVEKLEKSVTRQERVVLKLEELLNNFAIKQMEVQRKQFASALRLANKDRRMLRKELLELHSLLNEQVKDMKPNQTGNQYERQVRH